MVYSAAVALNIKDPETERLATELATRLNINKTAAVRLALRAQLELLESRNDDRLGQAIEMLRSEIWPLTAHSAPITKEEREEMLGYNEQGFNA